MSSLHETVVNIEGKIVTRLKSSLFFYGAAISVFLAVILLVNEIYFGLTLLLLVTPFLLLYPIVRGLMLGRDSVGAVLVTAILDYLLNKKLRSNQSEKDRKR